MRLIRLAVVLAVSLLLAPLGAEAQTPRKVPRVGILAPAGVAAFDVDAFRRGLRDLGHIENQTVIPELRDARSRAATPQLLAELAQLPVDVIVVCCTGIADDAKKVTTTIPIVMASAGMPVEAGVVKSLQRPGGNVTGLSLLVPELTQKPIEILREVLPRLSLLAVLLHSRAVMAERHRVMTEETARALHPDVRFFAVAEPADLEAAFRAATVAKVHAIATSSDPFFYVHRKRIADLALKHRLPSIAGEPEFVEAGGLLQYAANPADAWYRAASYVDCILKGTKPADLPIEQPTKFELVINLKTARALGLTIPQSVLARADQVIE
jgi:putative ABC transport system substrate-binding protein